jgi:hypothetical protein
VKTVLLCIGEKSRFPKKLVFRFPLDTKISLCRKEKFFQFLDSKTFSNISFVLGTSIFVRLSWSEFAPDQNSTKMLVHRVGEELRWKEDLHFKAL